MLRLPRHAVRSGLGWRVHSQHRIAQAILGKVKLPYFTPLGRIACFFWARATKGGKWVLRGLRALDSIPWTDMTDRGDPDHATTPRGSPPPPVGVKISSVLRRKNVW